MQVRGLDGMSDDEIHAALRDGARFVHFEYTISVIVMTFKRPSDIYFIKPGEGTIGKSIGCTLVTLLLGWWGFPWGPIYSIGSIATNLGGGKDVTSEVLASVRR